MIKIVDYGLGNISAFVNSLKRMNLMAEVAKTANELAGASKIILPGVGAFDHAMTLLNTSGMRPALDELVITKKVPVLGICVGMQILAEASDEGDLPGLAWVPGRVRNFKSAFNGTPLPLPHMGWNDVAPRPATGLFKGLENNAKFYFLHSFFFECTQPDNIAATSNYGLDFSCAVHCDNVYGVQFHPEKSHHCGAALLKNFAQI